MSKAAKTPTEKTIQNLKRPPGKTCAGRRKTRHAPCSMRRATRLERWSNLSSRLGAEETLAAEDPGRVRAQPVVFLWLD